MADPAGETERGKDDDLSSYREYVGSLGHSIAMRRSRRDGAPNPSQTTRLISVHRVLAATIALGAVAAASAARPPDLVSDPLTRQAWIARQAVYRINTTVRFSAIVLDGTSHPLRGGSGHDIAILGTGFAVVEGGTLVTAAHVVQPSRRSVAIDLERERRRLVGDVPNEVTLRKWADKHKVGVSGLRVVRRTATRVTERGETTPQPRPLRFRFLHETTRPAIDVANDLAVVTVHAPGSPALTLATIPNGGQRSAIVGFGAPSDGLSPTTKVGLTGAEGRDSGGRRLIPIAAAVRQGDSGGPAVDVDGQVIGMASLTDGRNVGNLTPVQQIRELMERAGLANHPGELSDHFPTAMRHIWAFELDSARTELRQALGEDPDNGSAAFEQRRVNELKGQRYRVASERQLDGALGALALAALLTSAALGAAAVRRVSDR